MQRKRQQIQQELFEAVRQKLAQAGLSQRDMPKRIIGYKLMAPGRYPLHMEMGVGEGWFEVWREGTRWEVLGLNPPRLQERPELQE